MKGQLLYNVKGDLTFHSLPDNYAGPYRIPNGIKIIANSAFQHCKFLTHIEIPSSVTSIGDLAFQGCRGLTSIEIPSSVTSIGYGAFQWCSGLTSIEIPSSVTSIGYFAFDGCSGLTSIEIPSSVTSIGDRAFQFTPFSEDEIKQIYSYVVEKLKKSPSLTITHPTPSKELSPQSNQNILDETDSASTPSFNHKKVNMYGRSGTDKEVKIPSTYTSIGDFAFQACSGLTSIEIPSNVTSIGYKAFQWCSGLTSIEIPSSVTSIGDLAFQGCSGLTSIEIPSSVTSIGKFAFDGCRGLTSIEIPSSVTSIGEEAFDWCEGLERIAILGNSTSISWPVFQGCDKLKKLKLNSSSYVVDNGLVYNQARTELFEFIPSLCAGDTIIISERVQIIHSGAFDNLSSVKSVVLPRYLRTIETNAFDLSSSKVQIIVNTDNLEQIRIENRSFFTGIESSCSLVVPVGTRYAYSHHPVWGQFKNITTAPIDWGDEESEQ